MIVANLPWQTPPQSSLSMYHFVNAQSPTAALQKGLIVEFNKGFFGIINTLFDNQHISFSFDLLEQNTFSSVFKQFTKFLQSLQQVFVWNSTRMTKCYVKLKAENAKNFLCVDFLS